MQAAKLRLARARTAGSRLAKTQGRQFGAFMLVGVLGFVVDAGVSTLVVRIFHLTPLLARIPAFVLASMVTFATNRHFTFRGRPTPFLRGWLRYVFSTSLGALLNYIVFCISIGVLPHTTWSITLSIAAGSVAGMGVNYICANRFVFRSPSDVSHDKASL